MRMGRGMGRVVRVICEMEKRMDRIEIKKWRDG